MLKRGVFSVVATAGASTALVMGMAAPAAADVDVELKGSTELSAAELSAQVPTILGELAPHVPEETGGSTGLLAMFGELGEAVPGGDGEVAPGGGGQPGPENVTGRMTTRDDALPFRVGDTDCEISDRLAGGFDGVEERPRTICFPSDAPHPDERPDWCGHGPAYIADVAGILETRAALNLCSGGTPFNAVGTLEDGENVLAPGEYVEHNGIRCDAGHGTDVECRDVAGGFGFAYEDGQPRLF